MSFNLLNFGGKVVPSNKCLYDSNIGYESKFDNNGNVDGWTSYNGIHTYGCWNSFLFGTLYNSSCYIGRGTTLNPIEAEYFYIVKIVMKLNIKDRVSNQESPKYGKIMWRTLTSTSWDDTKSVTFDLIEGTAWNTYTINMAEAKAWIGFINDIRIYPVYDNGRKGDEFFVRIIEISSNDKNVCNNIYCDYYSNYKHNCPGIGNRGSCSSSKYTYYYKDSQRTQFSVDRLFDIRENINDELLLNINGYGYEVIKIPETLNCTGKRLANILSVEISKIDIGGYAESSVEYDDNGIFTIYSGTYNKYSTVEVGKNALSVYLNFFNSTENISTLVTGTNPASGFRDFSSFKIKTYQLYSLLDGDVSSDFSFDPQIYNVEGGRSDWLATGLGRPTAEVRASETEQSNLMSRSLNFMDNAGKTIIDFNHPINASGRINKIYAAVTLDTQTGRGVADANRKLTQLSGACVMFFRPNREGNLVVLDETVTISDRVYTNNRLYSALQEYIEIDCDVLLNKGDLIGIYNANIYVGKSITGNEIDATYYQVDGKPTGTLVVEGPSGNGSAGIMLYARSDRCQDRLSIDVDFGKRVNIADVQIDGTPSPLPLDFNVARCLDVNWEVDLFGGDHTTGYRTENIFDPIRYYNHPNIYYGLDCLSDGIKVVPDGLAADSYSLSIKTSYPSYIEALHEKDGGSGVVLTGAKYFSCNGDAEWMGVYMFAGLDFFAEPDFENDPIAFTIKFPLNEEKSIYRSKIYFKEQYNFRSFAISTFNGDGYFNGDADNPNYTLIPNRDGLDTPWVRIGLDGLDYTPEDTNKWSKLDLYLADNPCTGDPIIEITGVTEASYDQVIADYSNYGGLQYDAGGKITNNEQYTQSLSVDWTTIEHEWEPIRAKGFRLYCTTHKSTKICEMELYCKVENSESSLASALSISHSSYGDIWWPVYGKDTDNSVTAYIGDTPRYINVIVKPINEITLSDIKVNISSSDVYMGEKGCSHEVLPEETKIGVTTNKTELIEFKNVYGVSSDLYVDIEKDDFRDTGTIFFSLMSDDASINQPLVGPNAYYKKNKEYIFRNYNSNVAINCPVYALKNLAKGAKAWYTHDKDYSWQYFGELSSTHDIDFSNLPDMSITTINMPVLNRSKWWKIGFLDQRLSMAVREIQVYFEGVEIPSKFYYNKDQDILYTPNNDLAPHLNNHIIDGSYYVLQENCFIGIELPSEQKIDKIIMYNDALLEYENDPDKAGIDSSTGLCLHGKGTLYQTDSIIDYSYFEHDITIDSSIYCDNRTTVYSLDFEKTFANCETSTDTFSSTIDTSFWNNIVNATVSSGTLNITNSGIIGTASTIEYYNGDFNVSVDLSITGTTTAPGWGAYLQADLPNGTYVRIGRTYDNANATGIFKCVEYSGSGYNTIGSSTNTDTSSISLRLTRTDNSISLYARGSNSVWSKLGESTAIAYELPRITLLSDLSPIASGITTAKFDNFYIDKSDSDWGVNNSYDSYFTCTSGVGPNGYAYVYDTICANHADSSGHKLPVISDVQNYPIDDEYSFVFDFSFKTSQFLTAPTGTSTDKCGISVGILGKHVNTASAYYQWYDFFTGAQVVITRDRVGIGVLNENLNTASTFTSLTTSAQTYFCRFTGDGAGTYNCKIWTDTWLGASKVVDITLNSTIKWVARKIGIGSGFSEAASLTSNYRATGWVSDFDFSCIKNSAPSKIGNSSIRFDNSSTGIVAKYQNSSICNYSKNPLNFADKYATIDFFIKFNSLPVSNGSIIYIAKSWGVARPVSGAAADNKSSWALTIELESSVYYMRFYLNLNSVCTRILNATLTVDIGRWYHYYIAKGVANSIANATILQDGHIIVNGGYGTLYQTYTSGSDVVIGQGLDGYIEEFRISSDRTLGGARVPYSGVYYTVLVKAPPTREYKRYYTFSLYNSSDNVVYGKNMDIDVLFDNTMSYHEPFSEWCTGYYTYFALDLGQRYNIDIIRSYPVDTSFAFDADNNVIFSNKETDDPLVAFTPTYDEEHISTDFSGQNYSYPANWTKSDTTNANSYIIDSLFCQEVYASTVQSYASAKSKFMLYGDFDFSIDYDLGSTLINNNSWEVSITVLDVNNSSNGIRFERAYKSSTHQYTMWKKDSATTWTKVFSYSRQPLSGTIRLSRAGMIFGARVKNVVDDDSLFELLGNYQAINGYGIESTVEIKALSDSTLYPGVRVLWDNFNLRIGQPVFSSKKDARWLKIKMLNGDGVTKTINNLDVYPNIAYYTNAIGQHNTYWESIGTSVTDYTGDENIALGTTVSGSSYVNPMVPSNAVDGVIKDGDIQSCWGSDNETNPYLDIYLTELSQIYRVKIYHGYSTVDDTNIITDYRVQVSQDGETFSTIFTIADNEDYIRTHDLDTPVYAKVVRIYVDAYKALSRFVYTGASGGYRYWSGAVLREVEIYKYYGFNIINSENTPVIAIDLQKQYFITGHKLLGMYTENLTRDWDNSDSNFAWANNRLSDPSKVQFGVWGGEPGYSRWVAIKRNTATHYPSVPTSLKPETDNPDYLKHAVIKGVANEDEDKPNPIEYSWMWKSNISTLSNNYDIIGDGKLGSRALKIEYPASSEPDNVRFIEGDHFGWDENCSWRDGFGINLYIDNVENVDMSYGYIYVGGFDYTQAENPVVYKWNFSTISGILNSGWNQLSLCFMYADDIVYTAIEDYSKDDPRVMYRIKWGKAGMVFRGIGQPVTMNVEGLYIARNYFAHYAYPGQHGLYLHGSEFIKVSASNIDMSSFTVEFFIRPDWLIDGRDIYNDYKIRTLFHMANVNNDVFGAFVASGGIEVYYGNLLANLNTFVIKDINMDTLDQLIHMAFVCSNTGEMIAPDGSTVRVYINNTLIGKIADPWDITDNKYFDFKFGGQGILPVKNYSSTAKTSAIDGVVCRLKIHNYCKTNFEDSITDNEYNYISSVDKPNRFIEISRDNLTFHSVESDELPFVFEEVPDGDTISIWVKVSVPKGLTGSENRTTNIIGSWDIGV